MTSIKVGNVCLEEAFADPNQLLTNAYMAFQREGVNIDQFDTMVGTGLSGSLVVPILARGMGKDFIITRKPGDSHHHGSALAEGNLNDSGKWIFVDDGIGTGTTYRRTREVVNQLAMQHNIPDLFHGAYLYGHLALHPAEFWTPSNLEKILPTLPSREDLDERDNDIARLMKELGIG